MEVQTPFVLMSMLFLPSDTFSNIRVTNGKVMTSGDDQIVLGYASPGLADSLKLEKTMGRRRMFRACLSAEPPDI